MRGPTAAGDAISDAGFGSCACRPGLAPNLVDMFLDIGGMN